MVGNYCMRSYFFVLIMMTPIFAFGMYNNNVVFMPIPDKPKYKELIKKFGRTEVSNVFNAYHNDIYINNHNPDFVTWLAVANSVIGCDYIENAKKRRYFLVNVMLHTVNNRNGLDILHTVFSHKTSGLIVPWQTPQGPIHRALSVVQYDTAMNISEDIRKTLFVGKNYNALIVIPKSNSLSAKIKWSLYKGLGVVSYLVSRCVEKKDPHNTQKDEVKKNENPFTAFFLCADVLQETEEAIQSALEEKYPCLKTHEVKSLIEDRTSWLYNRNNWILCGSTGCMALLLLCLLRDKLPTMHQVVSFVVIF